MIFICSFVILFHRIITTIFIVTIGKTLWCTEHFNSSFVYLLITLLPAFKLLDMKIIYAIALTGLFLLSGTGYLSAQGGKEEERANRQESAQDRINTLEIARYINNVNYTDIYDRSILMYASSKGYTKAVRIMLNRGADPNLAAIDGATAGMFSSYNGHAKIVRLLLEKGFDPDMQALDGTGALLMASQNGHTEIVRLLLEYGANPNIRAYDGYTSLMLAAQNGYAEIISLLLDKGALVDIQDYNYNTTALIQASLFGYTYAAMLLIDGGADPDLADKGGTTALMTAALLGQIDYVRLLLASGANINLKSADGSNALFLASLNGHTEIVKELLEQGAKPDSRESDGTKAIVITARDEIADSIRIKLYAGLNKDLQFTENVTAMVAPNESGALEAFELSAGSKENDELVAKSDKTTAFIRASRSGFTAITKIFLKRTGQINTNSTAKYTDLMVASMNGHADIVRLLLEKGANRDLKDNEGKTAMDLAGDPDVKNLLQENGN